MSATTYTQQLANDQRWGTENPAIYVDYYTIYTRDDDILSYKPYLKLEPLAISFANTIYVDLYVDNVLKTSGAVVKSSSPATWTDPIYWYFPNWCYIYNKISGTVPVRFRVYGGGRDYSYSYNMDIVPANSVLLTVSNFTIDTAPEVGNAFSVPITKTVSSLYDALTIKIGSTTVATRNGYTSGNVTFSAAELDDIYQIITTSNSATFTFELKTYTTSAKTTQVGSTSTKTATGTLTSYPAILDASYVNHEDTNATTLALTGSSSKFIQGYSTLQITVNAKATAQSGATLGNNAYVFEVPGETTQYANQSDSLNFIKSFTTIGYNTYNLKVIDSRGQQLTIPKTLTNWTAYSSPVISSISVTRLNGSAADIYIAFSGTYTNWTGLSTTNSIQTARFRYREIGGTYGSYTAITLTTNSSGSFSKISYNPVDLDVSKAYEFEIEVIDRLSSRIQTLTVPAGAGTLVLDIANKLLGVGKVPTNTYPDGSVDATGDVYAAGAVYAGTNLYANSVQVLPYLTTRNRFYRTSNLTVSAGVSTEITFQSQDNTSNPIIYLSSNRIYVSSRVKLLWVWAQFYVSDSSMNLYLGYPNGTSYNMRGAYGGNIQMTIPLSGAGSTDYISLSTYSTGGGTVYYDNYWSSVLVTALYV